MQETRRQILDTLRMEGAQTIDDLAQVLHLTRTAVTTHLSALQTEGLVVRQGLRRGKRRPSTLYALTAEVDSVFPKAYKEFAVAVLEEVKREEPGYLIQVLRRIGDRWIARDIPRVHGLQGQPRLERATEILAEQGFMPVLASTRTGYVLREHNCPVMQLAAAHPEVCDMIHRWLEAVFGTSLARIKCMRQGDPFSAYSLAPSPRGSGGFDLRADGATGAPAGG